MMLSTWLAIAPLVDFSQIPTVYLLLSSGGVAFIPLLIGSLVLTLRRVLQQRSNTTLAQVHKPITHHEKHTLAQVHKLTSHHEKLRPARECASRPFTLTDVAVVIALVVYVYTTSRTKNNWITSATRHKLTTKSPATLPNNIPRKLD